MAEIVTPVEVENNNSFMGSAALGRDNTSQCPWVHVVMIMKCCDGRAVLLV